MAYTGAHLKPTRKLDAIKLHCSLSRRHRRKHKKTLRILFLYLYIYFFIHFTPICLLAYMLHGTGEDAVEIATQVTLNKTQGFSESSSAGFA